MRRYSWGNLPIVNEEMTGVTVIPFYFLDLLACELNLAERNISNDPNVDLSEASQRIHIKPIVFCDDYLVSLVLVVFEHVGLGDHDALFLFIIDFNS